MVQRWNELGRPEIPLDRVLPGYAVTDLERFFQAPENAGMFRAPRVHQAIQAFLCSARHYRGKPVGPVDFRPSRALYMKQPLR